MNSYEYFVTSGDIKLEQEAFEAGEGVSQFLIARYIKVPLIFQKKELVAGFGVFVKYVDLELAEQLSKNTPTGLMRSLISIWYSRERLAGCSATSGINQTIRTAVFSKYINTFCKLIIIGFYFSQNIVSRSIHTHQLTN